MLPEQVLSFGEISEGGQIVINGMGVNKIMFLGSSIPTSCKIGDYVSYLTIMPKKEGVLAVRVTASSQKERNDKNFAPDVDFLLNIKKDGDDDSYYVNKRDHGRVKQGLCQILKDIIQVRVGEELFFSAYPNLPDKKLSFSVVDGDTICKFVAGDITLDELKQKAEAIEAEKYASERLPKLEEELERLKERASWNWQKFLESDEREKEAKRSIKKVAEDLHNVKISLQEIYGASIWSIRGKIKALLKKLEMASLKI